MDIYEIQVLSSSRHGHLPDPVQCDGRRTMTFIDVIAIAVAVVAVSVFEIGRAAVGRCFVHFVTRFSWKLEIGILFRFGVRRERLF